MSFQVRHVDADVPFELELSDVRGIVVRVDNQQVMLRRRDRRSWVGRCPRCERDGVLLRADNVLWHDGCGFRQRIDANPIGQGPEAYGREHW